MMIVWALKHTEVHCYMHFNLCSHGISIKTQWYEYKHKKEKAVFLQQILTSKY